MQDMYVLTETKQIKKIRTLFMFTYMVSYMTRTNFGAIILEMVHDTGIPGSLLSLALTGGFITYGIGQLLSGYLGDRIQPKRLVFIGLCVTITMNLLIPLCGDYRIMTMIWCVNGLAQAFMWPPLVRLMVVLFSEEEYKKTIKVVSWGSSVGTMLIYLLSPILIYTTGWRGVFIFAAVFGMVMLASWSKLCPKIGNHQELSGDCELKNGCGSKESPATAKKVQSGMWHLFANPIIWFVMLAIVLQGALRDGVTTWMPTFIQQNFDLGNEISILTGVVLPVFSILCYSAATAIYQKMPNNPILCGAIFFGIGGVSGLLLLTPLSATPALSVLFMAVLTGCMHGVNLMLVCMVPAFFKKTGNVSMVSGVLNSCTYVGSAISTYGIAVISESFGWTVTLIVWAAIAIAGMLICMGCVPGWKRKVY